MTGQCSAHLPAVAQFSNQGVLTAVSTLALWSMVPGELFEIEHFSGHHCILTIERKPSEQGTQIHWLQTFDAVEHCERIAQFVAGANEQNLQRLAAQVMR